MAELKVEKSTGDDIIWLGRDLERSAEGGFFETRTHEMLAERFIRLGFVVEGFHGMPGFAATIDGRLEGKTTAIVADMDALPSGRRPDGSGPTYAHMCGHHQQMTVMYGAARLLRERAPGLLAHVAFLATPAEEFVELERREEMRRAGSVRWLSGKQELIERGAFTGFHRVIATHSAQLPNRRSVNSVVSMNGFDVLRFAFRGKTAHAGATPHLGRNAQNAASLFLHACAFLREGFDEEKHIRIHPVLRLRPDQAVNLIPDAAFVETYARGVDTDTVDETVRRLAAAAAGCAGALGTTVETERIRGYAPFAVDPVLHEALRDTAAGLGMEFIEDRFSAASSDMGDVSRHVPSIIVGFPGTNGLLHQSGFAVIDEQAAYVFGAEVLVCLVQKLVADGGGKG
jgi:amidohydrolase